MWFDDIVILVLLLEQYFIDIVVVSGVHGENHWPAANYGQILSHNDVSSIPRDSGIRTYNVSIDRDWLYR